MTWSQVIELATVWDEAQTGGMQSLEDGEHNISEDVTVVKLWELKEVFAMPCQVVKCQKMSSKWWSLWCRNRKNGTNSLQTAQLWLQYMDWLVFSKICEGQSAQDIRSCTCRHCKTFFSTKLQLATMLTQDSSMCTCSDLINSTWCTLRYKSTLACM